MELIKNNKTRIINFLLVGVLATIPLPFFINSLFVIGFVIVCILFYINNIALSKIIVIYLLIILFISMVIPQAFINNNVNFFSGIQKTLPFLTIPLLFLNKSLFNNLKSEKILRYYSISNAFLALFFIFKALYKFILSGNKETFFFHNLVGLDQNAIFVSIYASFSFFYFFKIKKKTLFDRFNLMVLLFFIFLLSSKTIIFIDLFLLILYYFFFSSTDSSVKSLTFICGAIFVFFSIYFVPQVNKRAIEEYQTAFVDNTVNQFYSNKVEKAYNVSIHEAWNNEKFERNQFFPGMAYRVFHIRLFKESIIQKNKIFFGYGLNNTDGVLRQQYKQYQLFLSQTYQNYHNQYIQTFAETGVISFLLIILIVFMNLFNAIKNKNFLHLVFAITMLIFFFTESFLIRQRGIIFFVTLYCLFNTISVKKIE